MLVDAFGRRNKEYPRWSKIEIAIFGCTRDGSCNSLCQRVFSITKRATTLPSKSQSLPLYRRRSAMLPQMPGNNVDHSVPVEVFPRETLWTTPNTGMQYFENRQKGDKKSYDRLLTLVYRQSLMLYWYSTTYSPRLYIFFQLTPGVQGNVLVRLFDTAGGMVLYSAIAGSCQFILLHVPCSSTYRTNDGIHLSRDSEKVS